MPPDIRPFRILIPDEDIEDLHARLDNTRWPSELPGVGWSRGIPLGYTRELARYWRHSYSWRAAEEALNRYPQFTTEIDGTNVHFWHIRSPEPDAVPMIVTHGWPGAFAEFLPVIDLLTDPGAHGGRADQAVDLVVPSIPGYGFSGPTDETGWDVRRVARAWAELMRRLGYDRYVAQGGDWGMPISLELGLHDPEHVAGVHLNMFVTFPPEDPQELAKLTEDDHARLEFDLWHLQERMAWQKMHSTRPQTISYGLTDSPVGQLTWIAEKFKEWTDCEELPEEAVDRDLMLTIVSIYWFTATAGPSAQLYFESAHLDSDFASLWGGPWPLTMPVGVAVLPSDAVLPVRSLAETLLPTLCHWTEFERGGHFGAMEEPRRFTEDIREFVDRCRAVAPASAPGGA